MANALPRNVALVSALTDNPAMPTIDEIKKHQHSDAFCSSVAYYLESGDETNLP